MVSRIRKFQLHVCSQRSKKKIRINDLDYIRIFFRPGVSDLRLGKFVAIDPIKTGCYMYHKLHINEYSLSWINSKGKIGENWYSANTDESTASYMYIYTCQEYVTCINKERMFQMQYCNGLAACSQLRASFSLLFHKSVQVNINKINGDFTILNDAKQTILTLANLIQ